jgi:hypothetical protein
MGPRRIRHVCSSRRRRRGPTRRALAPARTSARGRSLAAHARRVRGRRGRFGAPAWWSHRCARLRRRVRRWWRRRACTRQGRPAGRRLRRGRLARDRRACRRRRRRRRARGRRAQRDRTRTGRARRRPRLGCGRSLCARSARCNTPARDPPLRLGSLSGDATRSRGGRRRPQADRLRHGEAPRRAKIRWRRLLRLQEHRRRQRYL